MSAEDPPPSTVAQTRVAEEMQRLTHDIRSAMSDVLGGVRLVDISRLDLQAQTQIARVRAAADTLAALVDDALQGMAGETTDRRISAVTSVSVWLEALESRWSGRAEETGCHFKMTRGEGLPTSIFAAPVVLDRIVGNLVGNALLYCPGSDVELTINGTNDDGLEICVADQGPGFPAWVLDAKSAGEASQKASGSGLGLQIVRELCAETAIEFTLTNDPYTGGGRAHLRFPMDIVGWDDAPLHDGATPDLSGLRILVAEDNLTNQAIIRQMLGMMGAEPMIVGDGVAALDALKQQAFDIGLIDIEMPLLSGLEVMEQVRASTGRLSKMPLLAITAYVLRDNREAIYAAGADGIIGKPITSESDFGRTILRHMGRPAGLPEPQDVIGGSGLKQKMDMDRLNRLLAAAGHHGSAELLTRVGEDLGAVMTALDRAVAENALADIRSQTHILIAISGAVGAERLCQLAEVLNIAAKRQKLDQMVELYHPLRLDLEDLVALVRARNAYIG